MKQTVQLKNNISIWKALGLVFKNSLFIFFSFGNLFLPIYATIISALIGPHGSLNVVQVGLSTSFISIFNQFLFLLSLSLIFVFNKSLRDFNNIKKQKYIISSIMLIYSSIIMLVFIGSSLLYIRYSTLYKPIVNSFNSTLVFILLVSPCFIMNGFIYLNILYQIEEHSKKPLILYILFFALHLALIPAFYLPNFFPEEWQLCGIALGLLLSSFISLSIVVIINCVKKDFYIIFDMKSFKEFFKRSSNFIFNFLMGTILKGFLVMFIGMQMKLLNRPTDPSLLLSKIIWYHSLFFCGFFADGLFYELQFLMMQNYMKTKTLDNLISDNKLLLHFTCFAVIATFIVCVIFSFISMGLAHVYSSYQTQPLENEIYDSKPSAIAIQNFLWSSTKTNLNLVSGNKTYSFTLMYLTIYHIFINANKIMGIKKIKINQKFSWKQLISNFLLLVFIMVFISVFGIAFAKKPNFTDVFNGLDSFSFALMLISIILFLPIPLSYGYMYIKKLSSSKKAQQ